MLKTSLLLVALVVPLAPALAHADTPADSKVTGRVAASPSLAVIEIGEGSAASRNTRQFELALVDNSQSELSTTVGTTTYRLKVSRRNTRGGAFFEVDFERHDQAAGMWSVRLSARVAVGKRVVLARLPMAGTGDLTLAVTLH